MKYIVKCAPESKYEILWRYFISKNYFQTKLILNNHQYFALWCQIILFIRCIYSFFLQPVTASPRTSFRFAMEPRPLLKEVELYQKNTNRFKCTHDEFDGWNNFLAHNLCQRKNTNAKNSQIQQFTTILNPVRSKKHFKNLKQLQATSSAVGFKPFTLN